MVLRLRRAANEREYHTHDLHHSHSSSHLVKAQNVSCFNVQRSRQPFTAHTTSCLRLKQPSTVMLPYQRTKVDLSKLNPQEQQLLAKYGKLPTHKNILMKMQKERKYFDSGDYALSKAGVAPPTTVGTAIPNPENIPHASSPGNGHGAGHQNLSISPTNTSPVNKESSLSHSQINGDEDRAQETESVDDAPAEPKILQETADENPEAL